MMRPSQVGAAGVVVGLAVLAVWAARPDDSEPKGPTTTASLPTMEATSPTKPPAGSATTESGVAATPTTTFDDPEAAIREALGGWGRFAVTGELKEVEPWFAGDGPQMARFREEAQMIAIDPPGQPPYRVTFEPIASSGDDEERRIHGEVVFVRTGEPSQHFGWVFVVRRIEGRWWVWTVENAP